MTSGANEPRPGVEKLVAMLQQCQDMTLVHMDHHTTSTSLPESEAMDWLPRREATLINLTFRRGDVCRTLVLRVTEDDGGAQIINISSY